MKSNKTKFKSPSPRANSERSQLAAANLHFSIHIPIAATLTRFHINATPTRRLLEPSRDDSRQSVQEGLASCFVSDRCSWPTVRHASSCTKAPLCAINHVKPAWSYKSLLWGNPPLSDLQNGEGCDVPAEMLLECTYWQIPADAEGFDLVFGRRRVPRKV